MDKQILDIRKANQVRGSVNTPQIIDGVDNDNEPTLPKQIPKEIKERPREYRGEQVAKWGKIIGIIATALHVILIVAVYG